MFQLLKGRKKEFVNYLIGPQLNNPLAYLTDLFKKVNDVNLRMQRYQVTNNDADDQVSVIMNKLLLRKKILLKISIAWFFNTIFNDTFASDYN